MGRDDPLNRVQRASFVGWLWVVALLAGLCGAFVFAGYVFTFGLGCLAPRIASFATGKRAAIDSGEQISSDVLRRRGNPPRLTILSERLRDRVTRADVRMALDEHACGEWGRLMSVLRRGTTPRLTGVVAWCRSTELAGARRFVSSRRITRRPYVCPWSVLNFSSRRASTTGSAVAMLLQLRLLVENRTGLERPSIQCPGEDGCAVLLTSDVDSCDSMVNGTENEWRAGPADRKKCRVGPRPCDAGSACRGGA
jgi:hypothetical protein